jgi:3-hydroxyisobutyrate dehydrogenase
MTTSENVAMIGAGLMGRPMAERLLQAGHRLSVYNRTVEKALPLEALGAAVTADAAEAIADADAVVLMLADYPAICDVLLAPAAAAALSGKTVVQMGTIAPEQSMSLERSLVDHGASYLEAPVLGSTPQAAEGKLLVMVGGKPERCERWAGLLSCFGPDPLFVGGVGKAAALKLAMNQLIAGLTATFSLSLAFVEKSGVSRDLFMNLLRKSALYAPTFDKKLDRMVDRRFADPHFPAKHLAKDVRLFRAAADSAHLDTAGLEGVEKIVEKALESGSGEDDYSVIFDVIRKGNSTGSTG